MEFLKEMASSPVKGQINENVLLAIYALEIANEHLHEDVKEYLDKTKGDYSYIGPSATVLHNWISTLNESGYDLDLLMDTYFIKSIMLTEDREYDLLGIQTQLGVTDNFLKKVRRSIENGSDKKKVMERITSKLNAVVPKTDDLHSIWERQISIFRENN